MKLTLPLVFCAPFLFVLIALGQEPTIGELKVSEALIKLEQIGDFKDAKDLRKALRSASDKSIRFENITTMASFAPKPYQYATRVFGFIAPPNALGSTTLDITDAGNITPDNGLKNQKVKVTLDRLRVADYPGDGVHLVLFDFYAQHQTAEVKEDLHFNQTYRAPEGQGSGITGNPIFIGLKVGSEGLSFKFRTVNVANEDDEKFLEFLSSDQFKGGMQLLNSVNPLVPVVSGFATGIMKSIGSRNKNIPVQDVDMGIDFSNIPTRAKLKEGSYIAVQAPGGPWDWSKWKLNRTSGEIVSVDDSSKEIQLNYIVFSISRMQ